MAVTQVSFFIICEWTLVHMHTYVRTIVQTLYIVRTYLSRLAASRAAIGFSYEGTSVSSRSLLAEDDDSDADSDSSGKLFTSESEYEIDMDVDKMNRSEIDKLNLCALEYGVVGGFFSK